MNRYRSLARHDGMARPWWAAWPPQVTLTLLASAVMVVALSLAIAPAVRGTAAGPLYSVAALNRQVAQHSRSWLGRTVRVKGQVIGYRIRSGPFTSAQQYVLVDARAPDPLERVPIVVGSTNSILTFLRQIPAIGSLAGRAPGLQLGATAIYSVELQPVPTPFCATCYRLVLRDAL